MSDPFDELLNSLEDEEPKNEEKETKTVKKNELELDDLLEETEETVDEENKDMNSIRTGLLDELDYKELQKMLKGYREKGHEVKLNLPKDELIKQILAIEDKEETKEETKETKEETKETKEDSVFTTIEEDLSSVADELAQDFGVEQIETTSSTSIAKVQPAFVASIDDIPEQLIVNLQGQPYITKAGLLWLGKKVGVVGIKTEAIINSWENEKKVAKYRATVYMSNGGEYSSEGIAIPDGQNIKMRTMFAFVDHLAETRAVNRALRMATNCGFVSAEEIADYNKEIS